VLVGCAVGAGAGVVDHARAETRPRGTGPEAVWRTVATVALLWLVFAAVLELVGIGRWRAPVGVIWAVFFALRGRGQGRTSDVLPVSGLRRSWRGAARGTLLGLVVGLAAAGVGKLAGWSGMIPVAVIYTVFGAALGSVERKAADVTSPGDGLDSTIGAAARGARIAGSVGLAIGAPLFVAELASIVSSVPAGGLVILLDGRLGVAATVLELFGNFACLALYAAVTGALWYGGADVIGHGVLRLLLWARGRIPWRLGAFLDRCARLTFLRRQGGGYSFAHRLLQLHFVASPDPPAPRQTRGRPSALLAARVAVSLAVLAVSLVAAASAVVVARAYRVPPTTGPRAFLRNHEAFFSCMRGDAARCPEALGEQASGCLALDLRECTRVGEIHALERSGRPPDYKKAASWYEIACAGDDALACALLADLHDAGQIGGRPDHHRAYELGTKACSGGLVSACLRLGDVDSGKGPADAAPDPSKAVSWYRKACALGGPGSEPACKRAEEIEAMRAALSSSPLRAADRPDRP